MVKRVTPDQVAKQTADELQPGAVFNAAAGVKQPALPAKKPLPAPLAKALGQS